MKHIAAIGLFLALGLTPTHSQNQFAMGWFGFVKGEVNKAKILGSYPDTSSIADFCVTFDGGLFDPLGERSNDIRWSRPVFFKKLFLLLSFPPRDTMKSFSLQLIIDKSMPLCQECDGGCAHFKESKIDTINLPFSLEPGERVRKLMDVGSYIKDWRILWFEVDAALLQNKTTLLSSSTSAGGWPWCK